MSGVLIILLLAAGIGIFIVNNKHPDTRDQERLVDMIDSLLPQTQCEKCGYSGCRPYAEAIVRNQADINQCPPGGQHTIRQLAYLLGRDIKPLNPAYGKSGPKTIAWIDEDICIGCIKCIHACPVDAIAGALQQMHTVIAELCTGCELCIAPCPVDCISMVLTNRAGHRIKLKPETRSAQVSS